MNIVMCNGKGGTGKTTVTMLLAMALHETGRKVAVHDLDPQHTASKWIATSCPEIVLAADDRPSSGLVLVDTPPRLDSLLLSDSLARSQAVIVVTSPSPADLFEASPTATVIEKAGARGRARVLFNMVDKRKTLARNLEATAQQIGFPALQSYLEDRTAYEYLSLTGWKSVPSKLKNDVFKVALEILGSVP